jgi:hypothetical protein
VGAIPSTYSGRIGVVNASSIAISRSMGSCCVCVMTGSMMGSALVEAFSLVTLLPG